MDDSEALPTPTDVAMVDIASPEVAAMPLEQPVLLEPGELRLNTDNEQRASVPDSQPTMETTADAATADDVVTVSGTEAPSSPSPNRRLSFRSAVTGAQDPGASPLSTRARPCGLLPTPEALAANRRLYDEDDKNPDAILAAAKQAQPEAIPDALFSITARVSSGLFGVSRPALVMSLAAVTDNSVVRQVVTDGDIIHVHRQPRNSLLLYLRTEAAKIKLAGQRCQFMGRSLTFESLNPLSDAFYLDILGVRSDAVASRLFTSFLGHGCQPISFNFTYRDPKSTITSGIVRYHFNSSTCPATLVLNGQVCDQVNLGGMLYSVRARGAQATQYHLTPNKLSQHSLEFSLPTHSVH